MADGDGYTGRMGLDVATVERRMRRRIHKHAPLEAREDLVQKGVAAAKRWFERRGAQPNPTETWNILRGVVATWKRKRDRAANAPSPPPVTSTKQLGRGRKARGETLLQAAQLVARDMLGARVRKAMAASLRADGRKRLSVNDRAAIASSVALYLDGDTSKPGLNMGIIPRARRHSAASDRPPRVQLLTSEEYMRWSDTDLAALFVALGLVGLPRGKRRKNAGPNPLAPRRRLTPRALIRLEMQAIRRWRNDRPDAYRCASRTAAAVSRTQKQP